MFIWAILGKRLEVRGFDCDSVAVFFCVRAMDNEWAVVQIHGDWKLGKRLAVAREPGRG